MNRKYYIYYHIDPRTNFPRYIGKGTGRRAYSFYRRGKEHLNWIKELEKVHLEPIIYIGNIFYSEDEAYEIEKKEIGLFRKLGISLVNKMPGGRVSRHELCWKPIICVNTGKIYNSTKEASLDLKIEPKRICDVLKGRKRIYRGYKFRYQDDLLNKIPDQIRYQKSERRRLTTSKPILIIETNEEFESVTQLANYLRVNNSFIHAQLRGKVKQVRGFTFKRL